MNEVGGGEDLRGPALLWRGISQETGLWGLHHGPDQSIAGPLKELIHKGMRLRVIRWFGARVGCNGRRRSRFVTGTRLGILDNGGEVLLSIKRDVILATE